ncbi:hypothetical protein HMPREF9056_01931 [Actinomyces sp. oral taxon 170 str. F0386]|nr:hypothetical protein HMPREF9056_01931 [Actinomyces sp. oral taxon 170 str. F0386]
MTQGQSALSAAGTPRRLLPGARRGLPPPAAGGSAGPHRCRSRACQCFCVSGFVRGRG